MGPPSVPDNALRDGVVVSTVGHATLEIQCWQISYFLA